MWHVWVISFVCNGRTTNRKAAHWCIDEINAAVGRLQKGRMGSSNSLKHLQLLPGEPALAHTYTDECTPGQEIAGELPGAHPDGRKGRDQVIGKTALPEGLGPHLTPLGMFRVVVQEQHAQSVQMSQEALPVRAGLIPVAQDVARYPDRWLRLPRR